MAKIAHFQKLSNTCLPFRSVCTDRAHGAAVVGSFDIR